MYEDINEPIAVLVAFQDGRTIPKLFHWRGRKYVVETINLEHKEKRGDDTVLCFSVAASGNTYEISFNSQQLVWRLEKTWTE